MNMWYCNSDKIYRKAFTVQELLIAMVVSSLIMGMMYAIYVQLNQQLYAYRDYAQEQMEYNQFKSILASDLFHAHEIEAMEDNVIKLGFKEGRTHEYHFFAHRVVRERTDVLRDTFAIGITAFHWEENQWGTRLRLETELGGIPITMTEVMETPIADQINKMYGHGR